MSTSFPPSTLGHRYRPHIAEIRGALVSLASWLGRHGPMLMLVWLRLGNTLTRFDRLAARWQHNRLRPPRQRRRAARPLPPADVLPADPAHPRRTPRGHAWLIRLHQPLAQWAPRIEMLVNDPDTIALCQAAPQAGRLLRPLCRMWGLTPPPHIAPPPRPPAPRKPRPPKPRPPDFAEHSPSQWPFVPRRLRLRVPGLPRRKPPD